MREAGLREGGKEGDPSRTHADSLVLLRGPLQRDLHGGVEVLLEKRKNSMLLRNDNMPRTRQACADWSGVGVRI